MGTSSETDEMRKDAPGGRRGAEWGSPVIPRTRAPKTRFFRGAVGSLDGEEP